MRSYVVAALLASTPVAAAAQVVVDGQVDPAYGAAKSTVTYSPVAPSSNFDAPTPFSNAIGYTVYLTSDADYVYGLLRTSSPGTSAGGFANLYFDLDPQNGNGSDIGFEITNRRGFVAGGLANSYSPQDITYVATSNVIEFAIPNSAFTGPMAGLEGQYDPNQQFATPGSTVTLRLSQSFGYSVAGGPTYGADRLGAVTLGGAGTGGAVPEPASWAMMIAGVGLAGAALRRGRGRLAAA